uniref:Uncharacterized protein n=1 Tax=Anguilla anguilla TaxID=7936 RepID=A0A0E9X4K7_ANGAN
MKTFHQHVKLQPGNGGKLYNAFGRQNSGATSVAEPLLQSVTNVWLRLKYIAKYCTSRVKIPFSSTRHLTEPSRTWQRHNGIPEPFGNSITWPRATVTEFIQTY